MMTKRYCTACDWIGYVPAHRKDEKRVNGQLVIKLIEMCPECGGEIKEVKY